MLTASIQDCIWSSSEKSKMRATALYLVQSIVQKHGGSLSVDIETDTININVPDGKETDCAIEIADAVGGMHH